MLVLLSPLSYYVIRILTKSITISVDILTHYASDNIRMLIDQIKTKKKNVLLTG